MQIKKEMNDDVEQHVTAPSWQCHKLTVLVALARGCTALWGTPGDYGRTTASTVPHSLYSAPQPPTLGDAHSAQMGGCGAAMRPSSSRRLHGQRISINESQEDKPMTKAELKQMEKEAFAEMKKLKDS